MVINDFDIEGFRLSVRPLETDAPFFVDTDAVLSFTVATQSLKAVAWQQHKVATRSGAFENRKPLFGLRFEGLERLDAIASRKTGRALVAKVQRSWLVVRHLQARLLVTTYDVKRLDLG